MSQWLDESDRISTCQHNAHHTRAHMHSHRATLTVTGIATVSVFGWGNQAGRINKLFGRLVANVSNTKNA